MQSKNFQSRLEAKGQRMKYKILILPVRVLLRVRVDSQSEAHDVNLDQGVNVQSSLQGIRQSWTMEGIGSAHFKHSLTLTVWLPSKTHVTTAQK